MAMEHLSRGALFTTKLKCVQFLARRKGTSRRLKHVTADFYQKSIFQPMSFHLVPYRAEAFLLLAYVDPPPSTNKQPTRAKPQNEVWQLMVW